MNIIPIKKKNGQIRICVDFRDLNNVCPKDDFTLPIIKLMVDATTNYEVLSFIDGSSGTIKYEWRQWMKSLLHFVLHKVFTVTK